MGPSISKSENFESRVKNSPTLHANILILITSIKSSVTSNHSYNLPSESLEIMRRQIWVSETPVDCSDNRLMFGECFDIG